MTEETFEKRFPMMCDVAKETAENFFNKFPSFLQFHKDDKHLDWLEDERYNIYTIEEMCLDKQRVKEAIEEILENNIGDYSAQRFYDLMKKRLGLEWKK